MNQKERVLDYMKKFGGITEREASRKIAVDRLSARIYDLKEDGYEIVTEWVKGKNRYGQKVRFKKYMLKQDKLEIANENHYSVI